MDLPVYLDHAATTPVAPEVLADMLPYFSQTYGNPATLYAAGAEAREAVDAARQTLADEIGASPEEIFFTSGGTEADNWALKGIMQQSGGQGHLLVSAVEHHAILDPADTLRRMGVDVEVIPVNGTGFVEPDEVAARIRENTLLVSVMHANNEVGSIQPVEEIGRICREKDVPFHCDAVQTLGKLPIDVYALNISMMTLSAHKLYGPKGIGALYIRRGTRIARFMEGGEQEAGRRAGTLNVPAVVGFGSAVRLSGEIGEAEARRLAQLRDRMIEGIQEKVPGARLSGSRERRLPNNVHFCMEGVEGESLLLALDMAGIQASAGSACTTGSVEPSHVLLAMGIPVETARGALRMTLGRSTSEEAVDYTTERLQETVRDLKNLSSISLGI
jgi:cysteine desulfurase